MTELLRLDRGYLIPRDWDQIILDAMNWHNEPVAPEDLHGLLIAFMEARLRQRQLKDPVA